MGSYLDVCAKPGCEQQINEAYAKHMGDPQAWLVYSDEIIRSKIAYIHSPAGTSQAHLREYLHTVEDWNHLFSIWKTGTGQLKLSGVDDDDLTCIEHIRRTVAFVLDHRMLFQSITGLDDARTHGYSDFEGDLIENNRTLKRQDERVKFSDLPTSRTLLYTRCVEYDRPDLWEEYLRFKTSPSSETWETLRTKVVPWVEGLKTVWQLAELHAQRLDGISYGLLGRFRDGNLPPFETVRAVLHSVE